MVQYNADVALLKTDPACVKYLEKGGDEIMVMEQVFRRLREAGTVQFDTLTTLLELVKALEAKNLSDFDYLRFYPTRSYLTGELDEKQHSLNDVLELVEKVL